MTHPWERLSGRSRACEGEETVREGGDVLTDMLANQTQSQRLDALLREGADQGYVTIDRILEAYPNVEDNLPQVEDLFEALDARAVPIYDVVSGARPATPKTEGVLGDDTSRSRAVDLTGIPIDDPVGLYLAEASRAPLLTHEEEVELAKQMERGHEAGRRLYNDGHIPDEYAQLKRLTENGLRSRDHLIMANTRLVVSVAKRYRSAGLPFEDLIQAGNVGLLRATDRFDYRRGYRFSTYATWWIRQGITRALSDQGRTIRIPVHMGDRIRRLYRAAQGQELGRRPTPEELAAESGGLDPERVRWMLRISRRPLSLQRPVGSEDEDAPPPDQTVLGHLLRDDVEEMLAALPPREARAHSLREVGDKLGVTRERVRQIVQRGLRRLRHPRHRHRLRDYLSPESAERSETGR